MGRSAVENFTTLAGGELLARGVAFIGTAYLTRRLGPEGFGLLEFAVAICVYGGFLVTAGFDSIGVREVARHRDRAGAIAAGGTIVRVGLTIVALALVAVTALVLDRPPPFNLIVGLTALTLVSRALNLSWVHKGLEHGRVIGLSIVTVQVVYVVLLFATVHSAADVWRAPIAQVLGQFAAVAVLAVPLLPMRRIGKQVHQGVDILKRSGPMILSRLFRALILNFDLVAIGLLLETRSVGLYGAAYRSYGLAWAIGASLHVAYLPACTRAVRYGPAAMTRVTERTLTLSAALGIPLAVGGSILAEPLLQTFFGAPYGEAAMAFRLLLASIALVFLHGAFRNLLVAGDRTGAFTGMMAVAAAVNVGFDLVLIPRFGLVGAAGATVAAEAIFLALALRGVRSLGVRPDFSGVARSAAAAAAMATVLVLVGPSLALPYNVALGGLVYLTTLALIGGIPPDIRAFLRARRRRHRRSEPR